MDRAILETLENQFWSGDAAFYNEHLARDALMVFAEPVGVMTREHVISAVAASTRWAEVSFEQVRFVELDANAAILSYMVRARQRDGAEYTALLSSTYVRRGGRYWLAFHQQTPDGR
jgi:hypothetical protein